MAIRSVSSSAAEWTGHPADRPAPAAASAQGAAAVPDGASAPDGPARRRPRLTDVGRARRGV